MKIAVLVKEVPDAAIRRRIDPSTQRLDRSGEAALNAADTHAIEAAVQLREGPDLPVEAIVAVCMGPASAARTLRRAISLGADRAVHLCDEALVGSDVLATAYALAGVLRAEAPDLVLLGQGSEDGETYAVGAAIAEFLGLASVSQVSRLEVCDGELRLERQSEYGYDTVQVALPALLTVTDALNEPRYPLLKAIMGAKHKPLASLDIAAAGIDAARVGLAGSQVRCDHFRPPAERTGGRIIRDENTAATVDEIVAWLAECKLI